jgi:hypothetical protein
VLVAFVTTYFDLYRVLDEAQQEVLLRLTPGSSEDSRAVWGTLLAQTYAIQGDRARARVYADSRDVRSICDIGRRPPRSGDKRTIQRRGKVFRAPFGRSHAPMLPVIPERGNLALTSADRWG